MQKSLFIEEDHTGALIPRTIESEKEYKVKEESVSNGKLSKIDEIRSNIIGFNTTYITPCNIEVETVYVDHTATSRPYKKIEDMIEYAKKFSANPHTEFSHFGKYST